MKKHPFSRILLATILSACVSMSITGCGDSTTSSATEGSAASVESTTSAEESSAEESTESSAESTPESSAEESSEVSQAVMLDTEKDVSILTLSVQEIPYQEGLFSDEFEKYDTLTVISYLIHSDYYAKFSGNNLKRVDERPAKNYDTSERLFLNYKYNMLVGDKSDKNGIYCVLVTAGSAKPSDYYFDWKFDNNSYQKPLSDEVSEFPAEYYAVEKNSTCHFVNLDGEPYFLAGYENGTTGGGSLSGETHHTSYVRLPMTLRRVHIDGVSQLDVSKFSYEVDEDIAAKYDLSKIAVTIEKLDKSTTVDRQCIQVQFQHEYEKGQYTDEELEALDNIMDKMAQYGYLVYNGENGKVKIDLW